MLIWNESWTCLEFTPSRWYGSSELDAYNSAKPSPALSEISNDFSVL